ncbi:MAG: MBL fold metallo-hydrolase [Candidatus Marinimicrobia bacterium]|nr:MBL fold metallo-hydrolase [Candidatus Neomarinimicrobiota bacterium]
MLNVVRKNFKYLLLSALLVCVAFVWYVVFCENRDGLEVYFLDVGQGDAIFIQAENGNQILIDGGQNKAVLSQLSKVMPFYDRSIDVVIETHPDSDHIGGLVEVLKRYEVSLIIESGVNSDNSIYEEIEKIINQKNITKILARKGMRVNMDSGLYLDILFPVGDVLEWETNDASVITKLVYGKNSFLFMGDSPQKIEKYLVSVLKEKLDVDVLKVGHHGSKTSSAEIFIGYTSPEYAVISVEKSNSYGHPNQEVLDVLNNFGVKILRTDELGLVKIHSDGNDIVLK